MNLSKHLCQWVGGILVFGATILVHGNVSNADLQKQYEGQVLTLRQFYPGNHLHFDAAGKLANVVTSGAWTVDGLVRVQDIFLKDGVVHIQGQRLFLFFDPESKQLRDVGSVTEVESARKLFRKNVAEWAARRGKVEIEVECGVAQPELADLTHAMNAVFLAPGEALAEVVPGFWGEAYLNPWQKTSLDLKTPPEARQPNPKKSPEGGIYRVGGGVSPPHQRYAPDPSSYPELAREAGYDQQVQVVVLYLVIDKNGRPWDIRIVRACGMGLDEAVISAVSRWRFDPAKKDGKPVYVAVNVEVRFH